MTLSGQLLLIQLNSAFRWAFPEGSSAVEMRDVRHLDVTGRTHNKVTLCLEPHCRGLIAVCSKFRDIPVFNRW